MSLTQTFKDVFAAVNTLANAQEKSELLGLLAVAREESLALQEENRELKEQIKSFDRFDEIMKDYELLQTGRCTVYQHKKDSSVICPHCAEEHRKIHFLQFAYEPGNPHNCPSCKNSFLL